MTKVVEAVAVDSSEAAAENLPRWNLSHLYSGRDAAEIETDLAWARTAAESFHGRYGGRLAELTGAQLGEAVGEYETIMERLYKLSSYAQLTFAGDMGDRELGRFLQTMQEHFNSISTETLFFPLELNRIPEDVLSEQLKDAVAAHYGSWIRNSRQFRPHQLSDELEELLHEKEVTGASAWRRLFDQTMADLRFSVNGDTLTLADTLNLMEHTDGEMRRTAAKALGGVFGENVGIFTLILNTLAKDKEIEDKWRRYPEPISYRNLSNRVEDEIVAALVGTIRSAYQELSHRYYRLKAGWFGRDAIDYWDRNAPLPGDDQRRFGWQEGCDIVLDAFGGFDPRMREIAEPFFDRLWIDSAPQPGKDPGAFCHPTVPSVHPYILLNFYGRSRDVTTLAHELGHGVHQVLAAEQGALMADTPLTLAETASLFGEMLVFRALLDRQTDAGQKRRLLAGKVENMLNTVVRQIAFHEFESRIHTERRNGELSAQSLGDIWLDVQRESLGPSVTFDDEYRNYWVYIPHFVHSPFYVYAYAFGDCLVNSLFQVYGEGRPGFEDTFIEMLRAGGTRDHAELLKPFDLDARDPAFWRRGLDLIVTFIDELEALDSRCRLDLSNR